MASRDEDSGAALTLAEGDDGIRSHPAPEPAREPCDWRSPYERARARAKTERARADAAEARVEDLLQAERAARSRAGSLKRALDKSRHKLEAAAEDLKEVRRAAGDAPALQAEVARLEQLLSDAGVESGKRSTILSLRMEVGRLRTALKASEARTGTLRRAERAAQASLSRETARLTRSLERTQKQKDTIGALREDVACLTREARRQDRENGRLRRELERSQGLKETIRRLSDKAMLLRGELAGYHDQMDTIAARSREVFHLRMALSKSDIKNQDLEARLAHRPLLPAAVKRLRQQEKKIASLSEGNARLLTALDASKARNDTLKARLRRALDASKARSETLKARNRTLEATAARLRASRTVLQKALFGSRSEQQEKPRSERRRGHQPGAPGHGRTQRPTLEEKTEEHHPPKHARVCSCCGKPYVTNGENSSTVIEIEVKAHTRRIVRPRWRRGCDCASSPLEVSAPPVPRLFPRTPYGTSVWACFLFERYACLRPLHRVSAWMSDQGLPVSVGTLADSVPRFLPLFEPFDEAIRAHQSEAAVRHGDETVWRIQSLRETGRSSRAWLWTSVSDDAVYFHIDPSRSARVATQLFGTAACILFLVCDRLSSYKTMAHQLGGAVVLCWCWAHQRRDFIHCAAGQVELTRWCQEWIERIASIYRLNETRLEHYDPALERQSAAFAVAQGALEAQLQRLFATAGQELADLPSGARQARPLRSLLNHRDGLSVFVDKPQVPMDNNAAERALRGPVIGRRLSFGSDSETGARFTALMYSVVGTLKTNGVDVRRWLEAWLRECAANGGRPPRDLSPWLPWSMSEERRRALIAPG